MIEDVVYYPVKFPSGTVYRVKVAKPIADLAVELMRKDKSLEDSDALLIAKKMLEKQKK